MNESIPLVGGGIKGSGRESNSRTGAHWDLWLGGGEDLVGGEHSGFHMAAPSSPQGSLRNANGLGSHRIKSLGTWPQDSIFLKGLRVLVKSSQGLEWLAQGPRGRQKSYSRRNLEKQTTRLPGCLAASLGGVACSCGSFWCVIMPPVTWALDQFERAAGSPREDESVFKYLFGKKKSHPSQGSENS